jgi:hypothetical protein
VIIVDDVDAGVATAGGVEARLIQPDDFVRALTVSGPDALKWLGQERSVWIVGDVTGAEAWRTAISGVLGLKPNDMLIVELKLASSPPAASP